MMEDKTNPLARVKIVSVEGIISRTHVKAPRMVARPLYIMGRRINATIHISGKIDECNKSRQVELRR